MADIVDAAAVARAVAAVRRRIAERADGRDVQLVAVTKGFGADAVRAAVAAGCTAIGENYAQELIAKFAQLEDIDPGGKRPTVHFIGQLQTNKVRSIAQLVDVWETVDRESLAAEIARRAPGARVFVQVNTTAEPAKGGCPPDDVGALVQTCRRAGLVVEGLMTVGPTSGDPAQTAEAFALLAQLAEQLGLGSLSMGMSGDFETALDHGATHIRIGSALFGPRPIRHPRIG